MRWLLFPCHLFPVRYLKHQGVQEILFVEHPAFYGRRQGSAVMSELRLNRARLMYMVVCHTRWVAALKKSGITVHTVSFPASLTSVRAHLRDGTGWTMIDPCDHVVEAWAQAFPNLAYRDSPSFLLTREDLKAYRAAHPGRLTHRAFYDTVKTRRSDLPVLRRLKNVQSQDRLNRAPYRATLPRPPSAKGRTPCSTREEWEAARAWIQRHGFGDHPGPWMAWDTWVQEVAVWIPVEPRHADDALKRFLKERFQHYGMYQDIVLLENPTAYHSGLSVFLNNGFLLPETVLKAVEGQPVPLPALEGFVRQIAGWREYSRLYYATVSPKEYRRNPFGLTKTRLGRAWYQGGFPDHPLLTATIESAWNTGYINHIQRLMVVGNYMTLNEMKAEALYRWCFEFSLDSYEWVMVFNCFSMGSYGDNGLGMRKPYLSSSQYLRTMSNAPKGPWTDAWDASYRTFMKKHADVLKHTMAWRPLKDS